MQHIIKKQVIELDVDKRLDSFITQESISRRFWNSVVPLLQKTFDAASAEDEMLIVDRLVIDIGILTEDSLLKDDWIIELSIRLEKQISELKVKSPDGIRVQRKPVRNGMFSQWLYYMQHGCLPWNTVKADENWYAGVLDAMAGNPDHVTELLTVMRNDLSVVNRIVAQHPDIFLLKVVQILTRQDQGILKSVFEVIHPLGENQSEQPGIGTNAIPGIRNALWIKILTGHMQGLDVSRSLAGSGFGEFLNSRNLPVALMERLDRIIPEPTPANVQSVEDLSGQGGKQAIQNSRDSITRVLRDEGIFAVNAGIVLLHPFLKNFFTRLQITKDNVFTELFQRQKALYLLHYLATGNDHAAEHELVIPRVLCAYPEEETVVMDIPISPEETGEADDMLTAAISQWEILKNTSISGLREGFLQRSGKLFMKDDQLYLQVETSGIDILLDRLPWSLGMIKLPWMDRILRVEWR